MGAGSSAEQRSPEPPQAGGTPPAELEPCAPAPVEAPAAAADPAVATAADPAAKLLQKNGQLPTANGLADQGDPSPQEGVSSDQEEDQVVITEVGQRDSEDVREKDSEKEMATNSEVTDISKDGQEEIPELVEEIPSSASNLDEIAHSTESQTNDVGFKKVFKFVGFKFTVKKDKTEKSDAVQLVTVPKEEGEGAEGSHGAGDHQEASVETDGSSSKESELKQSTEKLKDPSKHEQSNTEISPPAESDQATEEGRKEEEERQEKEPPKSPESPTSPTNTETASPFKKFFTQGWAGWRKKASFRKPKEDELEASEKKKEEEPGKTDGEEAENTEGIHEQQPIASEQAPPQEPSEGTGQARLSAEYEKIELPSEHQGAPEDKHAPLATEVFDENVEGQQEVVAEIHASVTEKKTDEQEAEVEETVKPSSPEKQVEADAKAQAGEAEATTVDVSEGDHPGTADLAPDEKVLSKYPEGVASEADLLSSQERTKVQGSPLKKLFSSSGLKKLSGKKQKGKRGADEELGEQHPGPAESPESADEQKGDSSASSPDEPDEPTGLEKAMAEEPQEGEAEEGATSDGEKKREGGITPWASFKKMVTPKKRVRRPSESDKEEEVDKMKSATLSSTESAASETQEDGRGGAEEPKAEEPRRKVDASVSWEALICVGSSKKRARKASSSDEEGDPKTTGGDSHRAEDPAGDREPAPELGPAPSLEQEPGQGSSSPEAAGSPSEGEGVSTWESFKRLVTPRKKSKCKLEEKAEEAGVALEASASDLEPGREESWVSIKKFIPGRRKKRSDGKREAGAAEAAGPAEAHEEDGDVPAVVPLAEYDAVEREKLEAQRARGAERGPGLQTTLYVSEEVSQSLVHTVTATVTDGARAVVSLEERAPSWISASVPHAEARSRPPAAPEVAEGGAVEALPESSGPCDDALPSDDVELTSEAVTAAETTEAPGAEETADMVSAVSQLTGSPPTTEEATPVPEPEGAVPDAGEQARRTRAVLQAVAEKVREESEPADTRGPQDGLQTPAMAVAGEEGLPEESAAVMEEEEEAQDAQSEPRARGPGLAPAAALGSSGEVPEAEEVVSRGAADALAGGKPIPPDAAETPTDSETDGSTPVAEGEAVGPVQQDEVLGTPDETAPAPRPRAQSPPGTEVEATPIQPEAPPAPSSCKTLEGNEEPGEAENVPEHTEGALLVGAEPVVSKTEVVLEVDQISDGEAQEDGLCAEGHEVSTHTDRTESREQVAEVVLDGEAAAEAGCQIHDALELQTPGLEEGGTGAQTDGESRSTQPLPVTEELKPQAALSQNEEPIPTVDTPEMSHLDGSPSPCQAQEEAACREVQVEGCGAPAALTTGAGEEVLEETKISEAGETLESTGAPLVPAEKAFERDEVRAPQLEGGDASAEPEVQAESIPVLPTSHEKDLEREGSGPQAGQSDGNDQQVSWQEDQVSMSREGDFKAELETESSKIIQNIIQTAVDQFTQKEETAADVFTSDPQTQASPMQSNNQEAGEKLGEEGREQAPIQDETQTLAAHEESQLTMVGPALSEDMSEMPQKILMMGMESSGMSGQQLDEVVPPSEVDGDGSRAKAVPDEGLHELRERIEKPPSEPKENKKGDAHLETQISAPADAEVLGGLTKESSDTNGPKVAEEPAQETGFQEGKGHCEPDKEISSPKEEELQTPEKEPAKSDLTER
ncbi:A-kinase anchor protein 12 [Perognathus longimembris pacificus]|uniref:A-kinase anchor protein 12 n=1 Tax=Perognathus longimembris pacificus TaxID=214514 RepID=UPI0020191650|nr:A-kinase anchor protein 12 [Perognathus longimembris pacificus]